VTEPLLSEYADPTACGDADFEAFFIDWHPTVRRWALQHYGASHADEIAQETLSRAFVHFRELRHAVPWPWLVTVARNVACDLHRNSSRWIEAGADELERPDPAPGPEDVAIRSEISKTLRRAVLALEPSQRELLAMAIERGMSITEMAKELGTSQGAIRVRLHRAKKALTCLYAKSGNLAVAPIAALGLAWRHTRRVFQPAASSMAPASALMMATAVVTVGVVAGASSPIRVETGHAQTVTLSAQKHDARATAPMRDARMFEAAAVRAAQRTGLRLASGSSAPSVTTAAGGAGPVSAHAGVTKDPTKPGTVQEHSIKVQTPVGDVSVSGHFNRGPGIACEAAHIGC
jgi:RNA polymerase sigma-70 factor, ECF subfamily